jgi:hypothetical protein
MDDGNKSSLIRQLFAHADEFCFVKGHSRCNDANTMKKWIVDGDQETIKTFKKFVVSSNDDPVIDFAYTGSRGIFDFFTSNHRKENKFASVAACDEITPDLEIKYIKPSTTDKMDVTRFDERIHQLSCPVSPTFFRNAIVDNWIDNDKKINLDPWNNSIAKDFMIGGHDHDIVSLMKTYFDLDLEKAYEYGITLRDSRLKDNPIDEIDKHVFEKLNDALGMDTVDAYGMASKFVENRTGRGLLPALAFNNEMIVRRAIKNIATSYRDDVSWVKGVFYHDHDMPRRIVRDMISINDFKTEVFVEIVRVFDKAFDNAYKKGTSIGDDLKLQEKALDIIVDHVKRRVTSNEKKSVTCAWLGKIGKKLGKEHVYTSLINRVSDKNRECLLSKLPS